MTLHHGMRGADVPAPYRHPIPTESEDTSKVRYHLQGYEVFSQVSWVVRGLTIAELHGRHASLNTVE